MLHRAASLLVAAFMLHLNALGIERACESPATVPTHEHGQHTHHQSQDQSQSHSQPVCCDSVGACTMTFELSEPALTLATPLAESREPRAENVARSATRAPDPPPPKT